MAGYVLRTKFQIGHEVRVVSDDRGPVDQIGTVQGMEIHPCEGHSLTGDPFAIGIRYLVEFEQYPSQYYEAKDLELLDPLWNIVSDLHLSPE